MARPYETVTPERRARVSAIRELRAKGLTRAEVAARLGLSRKVVSDCESDPFHEKARRRRLEYGGACEVCGTNTDGSGGPQGAPAFCAEHAPLATRVWSREEILGAILRFAEETGSPPISSEWLRDRPEYAPTVGTILNRFGKWSLAMKEAGFESRVGIKHKTHAKKGARMFKVFEETSPGVWQELGEFTGSRKQAVNEAFAMREGAPPTGRVMTVHPTSTHVHTIRAVERVIYEIDDEGSGERS